MDVYIHAMKSFYTWLILLFCPNFSWSQYSMDLLPAASPRAVIHQQIGFTDISIDYGRPSVHGRTVFGDLEAYDEVWRAGANYATVLDLSEAVIIEKDTVEAGKYALFVIPHAEEAWEVILNSEWKQWGAFRYDSLKNRHSFPVRPEEHPWTEQLRYSIQPESFSEGEINLFWADISLSLSIRSQTERQLEKRLLSKVQQAISDQEKAVFYIQMAEFYVNHQINQSLAGEHIAVAEQLLSRDPVNWNKQYYPIHYVRGHLYYIQAKILHWNGDRAASMEMLKRCKAIEQKYNYYDRNRSAIDEWLKVI